MNRQEIINKIKSLFSSHQFAIYKNTEGVEFRIEELAVGSSVYIITPEGELPAPDGQVELEDGTKVSTLDGIITDLAMPEMETEVEISTEGDVVEEEMDEATLADGTKVLVKDGKFEEGKVLYLVDGEGNEVIASEGERTTESGIVLVCDAEGVLTGVKYPDAAGEGSLEEQSKKDMAEATLIDGTIVENDSDEFKVGDMLYIKTEEGRQPAPDAIHETDGGLLVETKDGVIVSIMPKEEVKVEEVLEAFASVMESLTKEITALKEHNKELTEKFNKFSKEPAAPKLYDRKGFSEAIEEDKSYRLAKLAELRNNK